MISGDTHLDFTAKLDGHEASVQGNPAFNQIELRRIDKHQVEVKEKKDGAVVATIRDKLSSDGNELTSTTSKKGRADRITVWTRSGGKKSADRLIRWRVDPGSEQDSIAARVGAQDRGGRKGWGPFLG